MKTARFTLAGIFRDLTEPYKNMEAVMVIHDQLGFAWVPAALLMVDHVPEEVPDRYVHFAVERCAMTQALKDQAELLKRNGLSADVGSSGHDGQIPS